MHSSKMSPNDYGRGDAGADLVASQDVARDDGAGATYTATLVSATPPGGAVYAVTMPGSVRLARVEYDPHYATHPYQCNRCDPMMECEHVRAVKTARAAQEGEK